MAARKRTITKLILAFAVACLLTNAFHPVLSQNAKELLQQGIDAGIAGRLEEAESIFRQVIKIDPSNANAYNNLGTTLEKQGKLEEAIANYLQAIQLNPNYASAYNNRGYALHQQQGKLEEAITNYQQAIQLNPNYADAYNNLGVALSDKGKLEEAIASYQQAIQLNPDDADSYNNLGVALQQQGKLEEAIKEYQRSLNIDPEYTKARSNLMEAERLLAIKLNPTLPDIDDTKFLPSETDEPLVNTLRSTARIIAEVSAEGISIGAGWVVKKEGNTVWIVTNRHVISDNKTDILSKKIEVEFFSELPDAERPRYPATIINSTDVDDYGLDLAVLKVIGIPEDIQKLEMRPGRVARNLTVTIIGHPYNIENPWSVSRGEVVNYNPNNPQISMNGLFAQGNAGGPVIDSRNQVIGMMVGIRSNFDVAVNPNQASSNIIVNQPATGGVGLAYRIDIVIEKLREWGIAD